MTLTKHETDPRTRRTAGISGRGVWPLLISLLALGCGGGPPPARTAAVPLVRSQPPLAPAASEAPSQVEDREGAAYARIAEAPTLEACDRYLERFPTGEHREEVRSVREELRFEVVEADPSFALADLYLEEFPEGRHASEVRRLRRDLEWQVVVAARGVEPLREWLRSHPDGLHADEARALWEELRFNQVGAEASAEACRLYLSELPDGRRVEEVRSRCSEITLSGIEARRDRGELERWLAAHGESPQKGRAEALLEELRFEEVRGEPSVEACRRYLERYPRGRFARDARKLLSRALAWQSAEREDTVEGYLAFAAAQPGHPRRSQALERSSVAYWRRQVREAPGRSHAWTELAEACLNERACTLEEVESHYRQALERDPKSPLALLGLAELYYNQDRYEAARELLERSVAIDDRIAATHLYLGRLQVRDEHWTQALEQLDRALELAPDSEEALYYRGISKLRLGGCQRALPDLRRVVAAAGEHRSKFVLQAEQHVAVCTGGGR